MRGAIKLWCLTVVCFFAVSNVSAQRTCASDEYTAMLMQEDPEYAKMVREWRKTADKVVSEQNRSMLNCSGANTVIVPVAIHYAAPITCDNFQCLLDAAQAQIDVMNEDFSASNADLSYYTNTLNGICPAAYPLSRAPNPGNGSCVQFCLATQNHPGSSGLADGEPAITVGEHTWPNTGGQWPGYLNIFVSDSNTAGLGTGILGVSPKPGSGNGDGFFVLNTSFGGPGFSCVSGGPLNTDNSYNLGRTGTHEAGHYFDLDHTFQGCNVNDDGISDTPGQNSSSSGCPNVTSCANAPTQCGGQYTPFYSYMDYSFDACLVLFTEGQSQAINTRANNVAWNDDAVVCGTISTGVPTPTFTPASGTITVCDDDPTIQFTDTSSGSCGQSITGWNWTFSGAGVSPATSNVANPSVTVSSSGTLTVTLQLTSGATTSTTTSVNITIDYLPASDPACAVTPCDQWAGGVYFPFLDYASGCFQGCPTLPGDYDVWQSEAYVMLGLDAGVDYTFEFCSGYNSAVWEAVISAYSVTYDGTNWTPGALHGATEGCSLTFSPSVDTDIIIVLSGVGNCGGGVVQQDNGFPTFSCDSATCSSCGEDFTDSRGSTFFYANGKSNETFTICPDNANQLLTVDFSSIDIEESGGTCRDDLEIHDGSSAAAPSLGVFCGSDVSVLPNGGMVEASSFGGCLTFVFNSDASQSAGGWESLIECCTCSLTGPNWDPSCNGCPVAMNAGNAVSSTPIDNTCVPNMDISDVTNFTGGGAGTSSTRSACSGNTPGSANTVFFAIECDSDGEAGEVLEVTVSGDAALGNIDVALYGPVTGGCPNYTGGSFVACNDGSSSVTTSTPVNDGDVYLVVISTDNEGTFNIETTANSTGTVVPVTLISFDAKAQKHSIELNWATASEVNNMGYNIQRSMDGRNFQSIGFVDGNGNSSVRIDYDFEDSDVLSGQTYYYRLQQLDYDGQSALSDVVTVSLDDENTRKSFVVYPNPTTGAFYVESPAIAKNTEVIIYDQNGSEVMSTLMSEDNLNFIEAGNLANGVYQLVIKGTDYMHVQKIVILK